MPTQAVVALLVLLGVVVGVVLLVAVRRRSSPGLTDPRASMFVARGMSVGMLGGAVLGAIVWISSGHFVFWVIFVGAGMTAGMSIGMALAERR